MMTNVFVVIRHRNGDMRYAGIQTDGGAVAREMAKKGFSVRMWNMGNHQHVSELDDVARSEIKEEMRGKRK
jgi:hypothetical protein